MKLTTTLTISDRTKTCQVSAELELENQTTSDMLSARTCELLRGLHSGIAKGLQDKAPVDVAPESSRKTLPPEQALRSSGLIILK